MENHVALHDSAGNSINCYIKHVIRKSDAGVDVSELPVTPFQVLSPTQCKDGGVLGCAAQQAGALTNEMLKVNRYAFAFKKHVYIEYVTQMPYQMLFGIHFYKHICFLILL